MQLGIPFMEGLDGTQIGVEIDNDSFYIGLWDEMKVYSNKNGLQYYNDKEGYKLDFNKDITELISEIRRV